MNRTIYGWDLNIWDGESDGGPWRINAYPIDVNDDVIGEHNIFLTLELDSEEEFLLALGVDVNEYCADTDFWISADYFIQDYPYAIPERITDWLESLPKTTDAMSLSLF